MGSAICAVSALEMACWDIKGKSLNLPVYELLGGKVREELPLYVSDLYWEEDPSAMASYARKKIDMGFKILKVQISNN